jgi:predicted HNH restriction endonuclease
MNHLNSDLDNLIILCANCHRKVHKGSLIVTEEIKNKRELL